MKRSVWKGPYLDLALFYALKSSKFLKTTSRSSTVLPCMLGKTISIHNGKKYIALKITNDMIGFKLGSFVSTRLRHVYKKKGLKVQKNKIK